MLEITSLFVACGFRDGKLPCCNPVASGSFVTLPWLETGDVGAAGGWGQEGRCQPPAERWWPLAGVPVAVVWRLSAVLVLRGQVASCSGPRSWHTPCVRAASS